MHTTLRAGHLSELYAVNDAVRADFHVNLRFEESMDGKQLEAPLSPHSSGAVTESVRKLVTSSSTSTHEQGSYVV
jgi:hypothetical protein